MVVGNLTQREYEARDGTKRTVVELQVDEVGPSLRYASAKVTRSPREQGSSGFGRGAGWGSSSGQSEDPWATPSQGGSDPGSWGDSPPPY
jgi:single-strand DNA-binding protein